MAFAIHKTVAGDTLQSVAAAYFSLCYPSGAIDDRRQKKVTRGIRSGTPVAVTDLTAFMDTQDLGANKTLFIPTNRGVSRNLLVDNASLDTALRAKGFDHARKLLRRPLAKVISLMSGFSSASVTRAYALTSFLNLDGMDIYTAKYLYDTAGITSWTQLAAQSKATIDAILTTLVGSPHNRPIQLTQQRHGERWPLEAKLYTRKRISESTVVRMQRHPVPVAPSRFAEVASHYEQVSKGTDLAPGDNAVAARLGRLYRFAEATARGNLALHGGQWASAARSLQSARSHLHRLAEETGAATTVDDVVGINLNTALDTAKRLIETLPAEDNEVLSPPPLQTLGGKTSTRFGLRSFRYGQLSTSGTDRKAELRTALGAATIQQLPRRNRDALQRGALQKTQGALAAADANLVTPQPGRGCPRTPAAWRGSPFRH